MQFQVIEENYEPRRGQMDTRRLWIAFKDDVLRYGHADERRQHAVVVLDEQERHLLRLAMGLESDGITRPFVPGPADRDTVAGLRRDELLRPGSRIGGTYEINPDGPLAYDDLQALLTLEEGQS